MEWHILFDTSLIAESSFKLALACLLGGLVGFEREAHGQAAGFRTYILVALGSCLIMMVSLNIETIYRNIGAQSAVRLDPGRIASYALAGMGFLGAGAIITGKGSVKGLTTAAGMWMITAVGLAVGSGYFIPAILVTLFSLFSLYVLRHIKPFFNRDIHNTITLVSDDVGGQLERIEAIINKYPCSSIQFVNFDRRLDQEVITFRISLTSKEDMEWRELTRDLTELPRVRRVAREEGKAP
ncbi:MAG: MgtC/SapB family protein [Thermodesulfobacteriota bacterium]|nr:MgtC/SapB family protein [Thermodesulfobacteriota bacterium]